MGGGWLRVGAAVLACAAAAAASVAFRVHAVGTGPVADAARANRPVSAEIVLTGDPRVLPPKGTGFRGESVVADARIEALETAGARYAVRAPVLVFASGGAWRGLLPSQRLKVSGRLAPAEEGELLAGVLLVRGTPETLTLPSAIQRAAGVLRAGLRSASDVLPPDQRGLLPGLVVGDVSRMDEHVRADFRTAGLAHLTAVSGTNLSIVAGAALALGRLGGMPLAVRAALAAVAMVAFAVVARPSPSVLRALFMGLVAAVALGTGRSRDGVAALSVTVLGLVLFDPALARSYGFALSVCATGGILLLAPRWRDRMAVRLPRWLAEVITIPLAAQAAVTPVLVLLAGQLSPVAVPANLLAGPAVAPATLLGFAATLLAPVHLEAARLLVRPAGLATGWIIWVASRAAAQPAASVPWPGGLAGLALLAVAVALLVAVLRHPVGRRLGPALACGALVAVFALGPAVSSWPPGRWLLVACDVGQGDALVVAAGPGRGVVVDAGADPLLVDRCLRDLGVQEIPLLILTHPHADHVGGLAGVLRGRTVHAAAVGHPAPGTPEGNLPASGTTDPSLPASGTTDPSLPVSGTTDPSLPVSGTTDPSLSASGMASGSLPASGTAEGRLYADLARRGVPVTPVTAGTRWRFGPSDITVLAPYGDAVPAGAGEGAQANNGSVVVHVRWASGSALLSGDIETETQAELVRRGVPRVDVLKVPHHGAARQDPAFLAATGARAALISVGAGNDYGHPAPVTLARLGLQGTRIHRTDLLGDIAVVDEGDGLAILTRGTVHDLANS
ncbi:ComEC/Rec2 family competence protein [Microtetraspora sp. NBRC 13810]|uniref:ComEC/Rec2 family competence protein n=1 Tax=Microtetraspora sp. NBRC 13810 TaxID=3030990 RepID=UPI002552A294|nr:ComEC/Rec2 family competence protein [Microtetraspora sp. NBRC 13810]